MTQGAKRCMHSALSRGKRINEPKKGRRENNAGKKGKKPKMNAQIQQRKTGKKFHTRQTTQPMPNPNPSLPPMNPITKNRPLPTPKHTT
ncbi:uncharacterized protein EAE97_010225 [Botrytis byssoidea]|uniref:Uncharacterized protein n=1 Tax=Botrytis byssoidea TaxID=139641 RepID=A0A9P5LU74_9HELO|nr:uncharacterized protein EAE97_010225 [Botrytis byssoidea]KAF7926716.1 hypothetical protein EAE97_010225 [Botrytis byssoidea]